MHVYHRRLDEFGQSRQAADFREAVADGPSDVAPFELIDGDLASRAGGSTRPRRR